MRQILIDAWGRPQYNSNFRNAANHPGAYKVDSATEGVCYICYSADAEGVIQRITTADGVTVIEVGFGAWADRATLEFQEINKPLLIDSSKLSTLWARA